MIRSLLCAISATLLVASIGCTTETSEPEPTPSDKQTDEGTPPSVEVETNKLVDTQAFCMGPRPFCGTVIAVCTCGTIQHPCRWRCP